MRYRTHRPCTEGSSIIGLTCLESKAAAIEDGDESDAVAGCASPAIFARVRFSAEPLGRIANRAQIHADTGCNAFVAEALAG